LSGLIAADLFDWSALAKCLRQPDAKNSHGRFRLYPSHFLIQQTCLQNTNDAAPILLIIVKLYMMNTQAKLIQE
jgi:hypothetical protein